MGKDYGYARISTKRQSIERQIRNIQAAYPDAIIFKEVFTGTKFYGRKELDKLLRVVKSGDRIIFDSVSRFARDADSGVALYFELYGKQISLVFLKEPHINTEVYKEALQQRQIALTGDDLDLILEGINRYLRCIMDKQVRIAFEQAEKEVEDLHKRTSEGLLTAKLEGKQIGGVKGRKLNVKKAIAVKSKIQELSKDFDGTLNDIDLMAIVGISRNTFYKYKREIMIERAGLDG